MNISLHKRQLGVGLIEILVAVVVLSTALLALALLQARSLQFNHASYLESQSNVYAYDILERIRLSTLNNPSLLDAYKATLTSTADVSLVKDDDAKKVIANWWQNSINNLPGGTAQITCVSDTRRCDITISWSDVSGAVKKTDPIPRITFPYSATL